MGLFLRYCLFYRVDHEAVYGGYARFYAGRYKPLKPIGDKETGFVLHEHKNNWVVLELDSGWEREERLAAYLFVSKLLYCSGFFVYVYDGQHWGYELFKEGEVIDSFVNFEEPFGGPVYCSENMGCDGDAALVAEQLHLEVPDVEPYLIRRPALSERM